MSARLTSRRWARSAVLALLLVSGILVACGPTSGSRGATEDRLAKQPEAALTIGLQVGQRAPAFTVTTLDGKPLASADLLAQDKPFILYFFATW